MAQHVEEWASDVPPSMPEPPVAHRLDVPMMGFVFTENGLAHDITMPAIEDMISPLTPADTPLGGRT